MEDKNGLKMGFDSENCFSVKQGNAGNWVLMPYPCSHFYFDINFGDRLYSKEKRPGSPLLF